MGKLLDHASHRGNTEHRVVLVGLGLSTGELTALRRLLYDRPRDLDAALLVVHHLPRGIEARGVTPSFRDRGALRALERDLLLGLVRHLESDAPLRIWIAACTTRSEACSLAVLAHVLRLRDAPFTRDLGPHLRRVHRSPVLGPTRESDVRLVGAGVSRLVTTLERARVPLVESHPRDALVWTLDQALPHPSSGSRVRVASRESTASPPHLISLGSQRLAALAQSSEAPAALDLRERITFLEAELRSAKDALREAIQEMMAANEQLSATNEELAASNEALHSANEELQSVNDELCAINAAHRRRIEELQQLTSGVEHVFEATDMHVSKDSTDRKRAEERQHEAALQRDRFLAMLSHELRNPLAAIASAAQLVTGESEVTRRAAAVLRRQTAHIRDLLEDLLDASQITHNRLQLRKEPVSLRKVVARSLETVQATAQDGGIVLATPRTVPDVTLLADSSRLQQMLTNVLINAIKFTERDKRVALTVARSDAAITIRVRDDGVGLEPDEAARIFDMFYQQEQKLDRRFGGLGVGLSLARSIAEGHAGSIRAHSEGRGRGTTIEITLPLPTAEELLVVAPPAASQLLPAPRAEEASLRVVVVEDQEDNRELLEMLLEARGHLPIGSMDGEEAVETILSQSPDLALVDIGLPGIDGYEVARRVRQRERGQPIYLVALTGYGRRADRERAEASGFDDHVVKPMSKRELERLLSEARRRRRADEGSRGAG